MAGLKLITAPTTEPLTLAEAKAHLRVDSTDENDYITALITAARGAAENYLRRALITQTWRLTLDGFPDRPIRIPKPPILTISSVQYYDADNALQSIDSSTWILDSVAEPALLDLAPGKSWPSCRDGPGSVVVNYTAGYGATAAAVPAVIIQAIRMLLAHMFENREPVVIGTIAVAVPMTVQYLLDGERIHDFE